MKYRITDALSSDTLTKHVNELIEEGWTPIGGASVTGDFHGTTIYAQAMITEDGTLKPPIKQKFAID